MPLPRYDNLKSLISVLIDLSRPFTFVEIGVFKGDNAVDVVEFVKTHSAADVFYWGFDIFEDHDEYKRNHPEDYAKYGNEEYPYWEFRSGQHAYDSVGRKLSAVLPADTFRLIKGDSVETVPRHASEIGRASIIFVDGCHDYDAVLADWGNVSKLLDANRDLLVVFDDKNCSGVAKVKSLILSDRRYVVFDLNFNQFFVLSRNARLATRVRAWYVWSFYSTLSHVLEAATRRLQSVRRVI